MVVSVSEALHMSIDEVETKFTLPQLFIMTTIQSLNNEDDDDKTKSSKQLNKGKTKEERNKNAFRMLR